MKRCSASLVIRNATQHRNEIPSHTHTPPKSYNNVVLQSRNRDTDFEHKCMEIREGREGRNWDIETDTYTLLILCIK